jgi:prepilin-type N-terminal cleavage/methylation domain-containing protein
VAETLAVADDSTPDRGFTLVEMLVALLILGIVLAALAPAFYGSMKATATSNDRSVADGLAVAANEQIRSLPYYGIGYASTWSGWSGCAASNRVTLDAAGPMDTMLTTRAVGPISYTILRCVYWVDGSNNSGTSLAGAYKQSVVSVTWRDQAGTQTVTEKSVIYPGGEGPWTTSDANHAPPTTAPAGGGPTPNAPSSVTASPGSCAASCSMDLAWPVPTTGPLPDGYVVDYNTTGDFSGTVPGDVPSGLYAVSTQTNVKRGIGSSEIVGLAPVTTYYFRVFSVYQGTTSTTATSSVPGITGGTASASCLIYGLVVNPTQAQVDTYGYLEGEDYFTMTVNASPACTTGVGNGKSLWVYYTTTSSTQVSTTLQLQLPSAVMATGVTLNPDGSKMAWTPGNHTFTVYSGATPILSNPLTVVQVNVCQPNPVTGLC